MNVFQLLAKDHVTASTLINEISSASDPEQRLALYSQLRRELELHAKAEEAHFYPALKRHVETSKFVQDALDEHEQVKESLAEIDAASPDGSGFLAKLGELELLLQHHIREEETEIFPIAERTFSGEESDGIGRRIEAMKQGAYDAAAE